MRRQVGLRDDVVALHLVHPHERCVARFVLLADEVARPARERERPPHALILRSPFTSLSDVGQSLYPFLPVRWMLRDRFNSLDRISQVGAPLLVIAGTADEIVPFVLSEALYLAAPEPKWMATIEDADHNDEVLLAGRPVMAAIVKFLEGVRQN